MSFGFDVRCVLGTVLKVLRSDGVVEGTQSGKTKAIQTQTQKDETNAGSEQ
jgi:hypothetical protein